MQVIYIAIFAYIFWSSSSSELHACVTAGEYNCSQVLSPEMFFCEAQRSGKLPSNKRVPWRGDSMLNDAGDDGHDLSGGYFVRETPDLGRCKFGYPIASVSTILGWGLLNYRLGYAKAGELEDGRAALKWATDYLIKSHSFPNEMYALMGTIVRVNATWGRPEDYIGPRPAYKITPDNPGSHLAAEAAAALAVASMVFQAVDAPYAAECLKHAKELYGFAVKYQGNYSEAVPVLSNAYKSENGYGDELARAAAWLYQAADNRSYLEEVIQQYNDFGLNQRPNITSHSNKIAGVQVLLAKLTNEFSFRQNIQEFCDYSFNEVPRTPKGLIYVEPGEQFRGASMAAFICMQAPDLGISSDNYYSFARQQIGYMLGNTGRSFLVGYGKNSPKKPYHMGSACPHRPEPCGPEMLDDSVPKPLVLYGAVVRGPAKDDDYVDKRDGNNVVSLDGNVGFTSAVAGLNQAG